MTQHITKKLVVNVSYWCLMNNKIDFKPCVCWVLKDLKEPRETESYR